MEERQLRTCEGRGDKEELGVVVEWPGGGWLSGRWEVRRSETCRDQRYLARDVRDGCETMHCDVKITGV